MEKPTLEQALQNIQNVLDNVAATKAQHIGLQLSMEVIKANCYPAVEKTEVK